MVEATPQSKQCLHRHKLIASGKFASKADVGRTSAKWPISACHEGQKSARSGHSYCASFSRRATGVGPKEDIANVVSQEAIYETLHNLGSVLSVKSKKASSDVLGTLNLIKPYPSAVWHALHAISVSENFSLKVFVFLFKIA